MLTLTAIDLVRLQASIRTLLSPLAYDSVDAWRVESSRSVQALLEADKAGFFLALPGHELLVGEQLDMAGFRAYAEYYWRLDTGYQLRRKALGLEVNNLAMVYDMATLGETEVYNDFSRHYGFLDALAMSTDLDPWSASAAVVVYHERETTPVFGERGVALLELLLPALKAGATTCVQHSARRASALHFVDGLREGCLVVDSAGIVVHQTAALDAMLDGEPERARIRTELSRMASTLAASLPRAGSTGQRAVRPLVGNSVRRTMRTARASYVLAGSFLGAGAADPETLVLVTVDRATPMPLSDAALHERHGLTPREIEVARLLEVGHTDGRIAALLGVTIHTAQRHTERVLAKLDVHSRSAVGARLRDPGHRTTGQPDS